jgi:glucose/mannose-6-phosphate isomerase
MGNASIPKSLVMLPKFYKGKFTAVWDDRYLPRDKYDKLYAVMKKGKRLAIKDYIEPNDATDIVACVGNSGGDFEMMTYVVEKKLAKTLGILINPRGKLKELKTKPNTLTFAIGLDPNLKMRRSIDNLGEQFIEANQNKDFPLKVLKAWKNFDFKHIVGCGMGGSSLHYDIFNASHLSPHNIVVVKGYRIPKSIDLKRSLVIGSSYSGNTEETLACFKQAIEGGAKTIAITGKREGKLALLVKEKKIPVIFLTGDMQPRVATGMYFTYLVRILHELGLSKMFDVDAVASRLKSIQKKLLLETQQLVIKLGNSTVIIYSGQLLSSSARIAKVIVNENAKLPAFSSILPEANHNEIEGYRQAKGKYALILLSAPNDHPKIKVRFAKMVDAIRKHSKAEFVDHIYQPTGQSHIERIFSSFMWSHYLAYNFAIAANVKPEPVDLIEEFKLELENVNK